MDISFLFSFAFSSLLFSAICKGSSNIHFVLLHFFFLVMVFIIASCLMLGNSIHSSYDTLPDLVPWIYLSLLLYNHKWFDIGHTWRPSVFPYFLQFKSEFCNKEFMIWASVSPKSCVCWIYSVYPSLATNNIINLVMSMCRVICCVMLFEVFCYN